MTEGYKLFERQYYAVGREKLDGYTLKNLDHISIDERKDVLQKLVNEVSSFSRAIEPLVYLDASLAEVTLKKTISMKSVERIRTAYPEYFALWNLTKEKEYLQRFIACRNYISDAYRSGFYTLSASLVDLGEIHEMLVVSIFDEIDEISLSIAAEAILNKFNIPFAAETKERHRKYWKILTSGTLEEKNQLLTHITHN